MSLQEVGIDSLRTLAANVLVYDISDIPDDPLESLIEGYSAAHCMTQVLQRETYNPTTDIKKVSVPLASRKGVANEATYRLDGIVADETTQGIVISNQKKTIRR